MKAMREKKAKRAAIAERNHHSFMNFLESEEIPNFNFRYNKYNKYQGIGCVAPKWAPEAQNNILECKETTNFS